MPILPDLLPPLPDGARWRIEQGEALALLAAMPDASVDAIITDPPYSSGGMMRGDRVADTASKYVRGSVAREGRPEFAGDTRDGHAFAYWVALWLAEALRVAKPGSPVAIFTDWRQLATVIDAIQAGGWVYRGLVPWDKTESARPTLGRFAAQCEYVVWGSAGGFPLEREVGGDMKILHGVIRCRVDLAERHHMTGKPVEVMRAVNAICSPGGIILDPFAGSGSTGVAAIRDGYRFLGFEKTDAYTATAREWLAAEEQGLTLQAARAGQMSLLG